MQESLVNPGDCHDYSGKSQNSSVDDLPVSDIRLPMISPIQKRSSAIKVIGILTHLM